MSSILYRRKGGTRILDVTLVFPHLLFERRGSFSKRMPNVPKLLWLAQEGFSMAVDCLRELADVFTLEVSGQVRA